MLTESKDEIVANYSKCARDDVAVVIATLGRPASAAALLTRLAQQTVPPVQVILSMETEADAPPIADHPFEVVRVFGPRGMTVQRNRGLDQLASGIAIVVFFDDDFIPSAFAIERMAEFFRRHPHVAGATGHVLADGIGGPGLTPAEAVRIVDAYDEAAEAPDYTISCHTHGLYGCNMA